MGPLRFMTVGNFSPQDFSASLEMTGSVWCHSHAKHRKFYESVKISFLFGIIG